MLTVAAFYRFARIPDPAALRPGLQAACEAEGIVGTILLAAEGINGTVAGPAEAVARLIGRLQRIPGCADLSVRRSTAKHPPFGRMKVRLKREIVMMGEPGLDPAADAGRCVAPSDWNALISAPDTVVIDTRNAYETAIGSFAGAIAPDTARFRDFPAWWRAHRAHLPGKRIAMFCTGGIRCEKSTALLRAEGAEEVYHLDGGILRYLEEVPEEESLWRGGCFVFDGRVALGHGLRPTGHGLCHGCRRPLTDEDRANPAFEAGVACARCAGDRTEADRARYRERQRQVVLAEARGVPHLAGT